MTAAPVSLKKRFLMPSGKLRKSLRGNGHALSAIVQIGKSGVTPGLVKQLGQALADHELVKVKVAVDDPADRFAAAEQLASLGGVNIVQIVGNTILVYKRDPHVPRYEGPRAQGTEKTGQASAAGALGAERRTTKKSKSRGSRKGAESNRPRRSSRPTTPRRKSAPGKRRGRDDPK